MLSKFRDVGGSAAGLILFAAFLAVPIILLSGAAEFSVWALEWIPSTLSTALLAYIIFIPIALIPATRGFAAVLFELASFIFISCLWLYALAFTYTEWGLLGVIIGLLIFGVGLVFTGILAAVLTGTWVVLGNMAFILLLYVGTRLIVSWLLHLIEQHNLRAAIKEKRPDAIVVQENDTEI